MKLNDLKNRTLVITQADPEKDVVFNSWLSHGLHAAVIFKPMPKIARAFRRLCMSIPLPFYDMWLESWKNDLNKYNCVIIHASELTGYLPNYIHKKNPNLRIIYWYWNPVNEKSNPLKLTDNNVELWSFDSGDCEKFHMKKNIQYYYESIECNEKNEYDIYFIGHEKGRKEIVLNFIEEAEKQGLICKTDIISERGSIIPYDEVKNRIAKTKAILEINQSGQKGYTLRALESLFLKKKLITNNKDLQNSEFYKKNNIFIIGTDNINELRNFINTPYDHSVDKFISKYDVDAWFNNFFEER